VQIDFVRVGAYRSLYDVQLTPAHLSVLVGPNNSGKSNALDALDFLGEVHRSGVEVALIRKGGFENVAHRRMRRTKRPIEIEIQASFTREEIQHRRGRRVPRRSEEAQLFDPDPFASRAVTLRHCFALKAVSGRMDTDFSVLKEEIEIVAVNENGRQRSVIVRRERQDVVWDLTKAGPPQSGDARSESEFYPIDDVDFQAFAEKNVRETELLTGVLTYNSFISTLQGALASSKLCHLSPKSCREPGVSSPNADIEASGSNLPALAAHLARSYPGSWERVISAMRMIVPDLEDIRIDFTHDRRLTLEFVERGVGRAWTSEDVSDGTIQSLALFSVLFDPRSAFALIEEPENSVHPWIIRNFVDACREAVDKQVLITTHSPVLINYLGPEDISLVWRKGGRTTIAPLTSLDPDLVDAWERGEIGLFDIFDTGVIAQSVPGGFA